MIVRALAAAAVAIAQIAIAAGDLPFGKERWRVVDNTISPPQPVAGATVIVTYRTYIPAFPHGMRTCTGVELATSDAQGWVQIKGGKGARIAAHKAGYAEPLDTMPVHGPSRMVYLRANPSYEQRVNHFRQLKNTSSCEADRDPREARAFLEAVIPELRQIARTPDALEILHGMEWWVDVLRRVEREQR